MDTKNNMKISSIVADALMVSSLFIASESPLIGLLNGEMFGWNIYLVCSF